MATFNNGESGLSVRTKLNEIINKVEGVTSINNDIDVTGTVTADGLTVEQNVGSKITLKSTDTAIVSGETIGDIEFYSSDASGIGAAPRANITVEAADAAGSGSMYFKTSTGAGSTLDRMLIEGTGDISFYDSQGSSQSFFWDASAERLGIGTTTPEKPLHVNSDTGNIGIRVESTDATSSIEFLDSGTTSSLLSPRVGGISDDFFVQTSGTERLRIDASGNVGIGVAPSAWDTLPAIQVSTYGGLSAGGGYTRLSSNAYLSTYPNTWSRISTNTASLYEQVGGQHVWSTAASGSAGTAISFSEAMRIDASGNLLVGMTTTPAEDGWSSEGFAYINGDYMAVTRDSNIVAYFNRTGTDGDILAVRKDGTTVGSIGVESSAAYFAGVTYGIKPYSAGVAASNSSGVFADGTADLGKDNIRWKDLYLSGDTFVGEPSTIGAGEAGVTVRGLGQVRVGRAGTASVTLVSFNNGNGEVGTIVTSGSATAYNTSSDYRLKTDAQPMTGATDRLKQLNPVNFEWITDGTRVDGFLAHEAQAVVPEAVTGAKDAMRDEEYEVTPAVLDDDGNVVTEAVMGTRSVPDYQGIDQSKLVPLLTAALQEALTKIDALETRITALEG